MIIHTQMSGGVPYPTYSLSLELSLGMRLTRSNKLSLLSIIACDTHRFKWTVKQSLDLKSGKKVGGVF